LKRPKLIFFVDNSFGRTFHTLAHLDINDLWNVAVLHFGVVNFKQSGSVAIDVYYPIYTFKVKHQIEEFVPIAERNEV
jgi:hypothetical protein